MLISFYQFWNDHDYGLFKKVSLSVKFLSGSHKRSQRDSAAGAHCVFACCTGTAHVCEVAAHILCHAILSVEEPHLQGCGSLVHPLHETGCHRTPSRVGMHISSTRCSSSPDY